MCILSRDALPECMGPSLWGPCCCGAWPFPTQRPLSGEESLDPEDGCRRRLACLRYSLTEAVQNSYYFEGASQGKPIFWKARADYLGATSKHLNTEMSSKKQVRERTHKQHHTGECFSLLPLLSRFLSVFSSGLSLVFVSFLSLTPQPSFLPPTDYASFYTLPLLGGSPPPRRYVFTSILRQTNTQCAFHIWLKYTKKILCIVSHPMSQFPNVHKKSKIHTHTTMPLFPAQRCIPALKEAMCDGALRQIMETFLDVCFIKAVQNVWKTGRLAYCSINPVCDLFVVVSNVTSPFGLISCTVSTNCGHCNVHKGVVKTECNNIKI